MCIRDRSRSRPPFHFCRECEEATGPDVYVQGEHHALPSDGRPGLALSLIHIFKTQAFQRVEQYVEESVKAVMQRVEQVGGREKIRAMGIGAPCGNYYKGTIETDVYKRQLILKVCS